MLCAIPASLTGRVIDLHVAAGYSSSSGSSGSEFSAFMMAAKDKEAAEAEASEGSGSGSRSRRNALWGSRVAKFLSSCSGSLGSTGMPPLTHFVGLTGWRRNALLGIRMTVCILSFLPSCKLSLVVGCSEYMGSCEVL